MMELAVEWIYIERTEINKNEHLKDLKKIGLVKLPKWYEFLFIRSRLVHVSRIQREDIYKFSYIFLSHAFIQY